MRSKMLIMLLNLLMGGKRRKCFLCMFLLSSPFLYEWYSRWDPLCVLAVLFPKHSHQATFFEPDSAVEEVPDDASKSHKGYGIRQEDLCGDCPDVPPKVGRVTGERVDAVCNKYVSLAFVPFDFVVKV